MKRYFRIFLMLCVLFAGYVPAAAEGEQDSDYTETNPLYAGEIDEMTLMQHPEVSADAETAEMLNGDMAEFYDPASAAVFMRSHLKQRDETFAFVYHIGKDVYDSSAEAFRTLTKSLWDESLEHTGEPDEGDYLKWQWSNWKAARKTEESEDAYSIAITYTVTYFTTAEQEKEVDAAIQAILNSFALPANCTQYDKIAQIYEWCTTHIRYVNDGTTYCHSCHAAVIGGEAVCQGYALTFYRLALALGIDNRLIGGTVSSENHGWNIVELEGMYYNVDPTWDGMYKEGGTQWFLKGSENFTSRVRWGEGRRYNYDSPEFHAKYPTDAKDYDRTRIEAIHRFVTALYQKCLSREPERRGLYDWSGLLYSNKKTAAEVARGFFYSSEFQRASVSDAKFTEICYRVFLDRASDSSGRQYWIKEMEQGKSRLYVLRGFIRSAEFAAICSRTQIERGDVTLTEYRDRYPKLSAFISRLYTKALMRRYDVYGLNDWVRRNVEKSVTPRETAVNGFLRSVEFISRDLSNTEYIKVLYRVFMDREGEDGGIRYWNAMLSSGMTRTTAAERFADSEEFAAILKQFGI